MKNGIHRLLLLPLVAALGLLGGCKSDRAARDYADRLTVVLHSYQQQVDAKIAAEQKYYREIAEIAAEQREKNIYLLLGQEQSRRSLRQADVLLRGGIQKAPSRSELQEQALEYGTYDFGQTRALLEEEESARAEMLAQLEALDFDSKRIQSLTESLQALAKPKSRSQQIKDLIAFADKVDEEFNRLDCNALATQIAAGQAELQQLQSSPDATSPATKKKIDELTKKIAILTKKRATKGCEPAAP